MSEHVEHVAALREAWASHLRTQRQVERGPSRARDYVYASGRKACVRRMALDLMHPEEESPLTDDALERFERGKEAEHALITRLHRIGPRCTPPFEVAEGQRPFEVRDRDGQLLIRGKVDCRLSFSRKVRPILEAKSGQSYARCRTLDDVKAGAWTRSAVDQILAYLLAAEEEWGILALIKPSGLPLFLPVELYVDDHLERAEAFLRDARAAVDAARGGELPPYFSEVSECRKCPHFGRSCTPPDLSYSGASLIDDPELIEAAEIREKNRAAHKAYEKADELLKAELHGTQLAILGPYEVRGRLQRKTTYEIPADVKARYRKTVEDGDWRLVSLTRLVDEPLTEDEEETS